MRRILLVDDEPHVIRVIKLALRPQRLSRWMWRATASKRSRSSARKHTTC